MPFSRLLAASTLALATCVVGVSVPTGVAAAVAPTARADAPPQVRIGTYNIISSASLGTFKSAVSAFKPYVDVAGLQEIGLNAKNKFLLKDHGWGYYRPPAIQQNPIIWRRDVFDFVSARGIKIAKARKVGGAYGGDEAKGDSWAIVVRLVVHATGEQIAFINVHLVHAAVRAGQPWPGRAKLYHLYTDQVAGAVKAYQAERANPHNDQVFISGDWNAGYEADLKHRVAKLPVRQFHKIGVHSMWQGSPLLRKPYGTHGTALIDQVWNPTLPASTQILRSVKGSDHSPAVATYDLPAAPTGYVPPSGTVGFAGPPPPRDEYYHHGQEMEFHLTGDLAHGWADVRVVGGTATEGVDFTIDDESLQPYSGSIRVTILKDHKVERDETFELELVDPVNTVVTAPTVTGTISANKT